MERHENGRFSPKDCKPKFTSEINLPKTNLDVIKLYQKFGILPTHFKNTHLDLKIVQLKGSKRGDVLNDLLSLSLPTTDIYPSVRPILNRHSKIDLVKANQILYDICLDIKHVSICQKHGWVKSGSNGKLNVNNAPVTRLRSNFFSLHFLIS